ncbi:MAG: tetratricopeptide repeat protein, partial [Planctomycetaceae bacterium]
QAEQAFLEVERLGRFDGPVNLARVYLVEGRIDEAVDALERAGRHTAPPAPPRTLAWFNGVVNKQQGYLDRAAENFRGVLEDQTAERRQRGLRFERDFVVRNELAQTLFELGKQEREDEGRRSELLRESARQFEQVLFYDSEDVMAHYNLGLLYAELGETEKSELHRRLHQRYKPDDNAQELAVNAARRKYPAANVAAEPLVIYPLNRPGAPGLPGSEQAAASPRAEPLAPVPPPGEPRGAETTPDPAGE